MYAVELIYYLFFGLKSGLVLLKLEFYLVAFSVSEILYT